MMAEPLLQARELAKSYGPVVALRSADLVVAPGEVHALLGANGAGKSTLVKILTGVIAADSGSIQVNGKPARPKSPAGAARIGLAPVFQDPALVPDLTVSANLRLTGADTGAVRRELETMELDVDFRAFVGDVPLPLLRMIDLARALSRDPQLLLLDEITAALPSDLAERVFAVMRARREQGRSVLFITHRLKEVIQTCDRATILRDGGAVATIVPQEGGEEAIVAHMLGEAAARAAVAAAAEDAATTPVPKPAAEVAALEVDGLRFAGSDGVSFSLAPGEVLGIAALDGQGQDELFDALAGATSAEGGEIRVGGQAAQGAASVRRDPGGRRARPGRPPPRPAATALGAREHRLTALQHRPPLGADLGAGREPPCGQGDRRAADRHPRRAAGAPALGRQPAEGDDRALARLGVPHDALLRRDARHRRRHEAPDPHAAAEPRGRRRRHPLLLERAGRVPARLRPRADPVRRPHHGGAARPRRRRGDAPARDARARRGGHGRVSATPATAARTPTSFDWRRLVRRHGWTVGVYVLLAVVVLYWRSVTNLPWGPFDVQSVCIDALPLAFVACGQAIVIISGGIDLSVGSLMSLINVIAARWMLNMSFREALGYALLLVLLGALAGALTGLLIVVTRVADIIVTLAMLFVWQGAALAVLTIPGGGIPARLGTLVNVDTVGTTWLPASLVLLIVIVAVIWIPIRTTRAGLALYAIGSNRNAAYLAGVNVAAHTDRGVRAERGVRRDRGRRADGHVEPGRPELRAHLHAELGGGGRTRRRLAARRRGRPRRPDRSGVRADARQDDPDPEERRPELGPGDPGRDHRRRDDDRRPHDPAEGQERRMSVQPEVGR